MIPAQWGVSLASREELMATMRKATPAIAIPSRSCKRATSKGKRQPQQIWASSVTGPSVPAFPFFFFFSLPGGALPPPEDPSGLVPIPIIPYFPLRQLFFLLIVCLSVLFFLALCFCSFPQPECSCTHCLPLSALPFPSLLTGGVREPCYWESERALN